MSDLLLTSGMSGGGDIQFSRPDFKIAVQFNTGGYGPTMNYDGYAHYRNAGMRCLWNFYDTSSNINPTSGANGIHYLATSTYVGPSGFGNHAQLWPIMDMLYMDCEISSLKWGVADANDVQITAGNGGVSGTTLTVTGGDTSSIVRGARLTGAGIAADTWVTAFTNPTITMSPANAVADGTTVTVSGRISDTTALRAAVDAQMATEMAGNPGVAKLIGAYSGAPCGYLGYASYSFWMGYSTKTAIAATRAGNDACGQYITQHYDFCLPELYTSQMENVSATLQFWIAEKTRRGSSVPIFPIMQPTAGVSEQSYDTCTTYLEYMIRCPEIAGCAFWAVNNTHLPSAAPTWYDDGTFPWMDAIQDFIDKYGLSL